VTAGHQRLVRRRGRQDDRDCGLYLRIQDGEPAIVGYAVLGHCDRVAVGPLTDDDHGEDGCAELRGGGEPA
jgi:hypothetical protein